MRSTVLRENGSGSGRRLERTTTA
uniref:Uncharacterized protein n=1 Tax=Arundo donax TaxID=35708 RepID=A0A0A8YWA6_ARUDO